MTLQLKNSFGARLGAVGSIHSSKTQGYASSALYLDVDSVTEDIALLERFSVAAGDPCGGGAIESVRVAEEARRVRQRLRIEPQVSLGRGSFCSK